MLGTKTKQIYSYGKRSQRIVSVSENRDMKPSIFDDIQPAPRAPIASKMKKREHTVHSNRTPSPKVVHINRKKRYSPPVSPAAKFARLAQLLDADTIRALPKSKSDVSVDAKLPGTPSRPPLAPFSLNTPRTSIASGRKSVATKGHGAKGKPPTLKPFSPFVDVDITVLDDSGKTVTREARVSRPDVQTNPINDTARTPVNVVEEVQDDDTPVAIKRPKRRAVVTIQSDSESEVEVEDIPQPLQSRRSKPPSPTPTTSTSSHPSAPCSAIPGTSRLKVEVLVPRAPYTIKSTTMESLRPKVTDTKPLSQPWHHRSSSPPLVRPRQLTPIRRRGGIDIFNPPLPSPSPSLASDLDLSFDLEDFNFIGASSVVKSSNALRTTVSFRKIGEASYSEVFGIGDVVLKVIPIRDESIGNEAGGQDVSEDEGPAPSDAKDVLKEIIVTEAMGNVCEGFVSLLKAYVVRGKYPEMLLRLWDEYDMTKGSQSVRPDKFLVSQVYAIIVLPNGGPDLEEYKFVHPGKTGWRQACSIFWQVARSLAQAEQLVSFEHRDLHMGQILIKDIATQSEAPRLQTRNQNVRSTSTSQATRVYMDDPTHGVRATLIDLGLSRMDAGDGNGGEMIHWTPFEEEVFMGEGDYQYDIYRMMKAHNGDSWEDFKPLTNVMWLHYLVVTLMKAKRLRAPSASRASPSSDAATYTEKDCYDCALDSHKVQAQREATQKVVKDLLILAKEEGRLTLSQIVFFCMVPFIDVPAEVKYQAIHMSGKECVGASRIDSPKIREPQLALETPVIYDPGNGPVRDVNYFAPPSNYSGCLL
ncbi:hypothetical protein H0H93_000021 [Arthromyces matolae]|nr:hypothetical protein H0H93_000021 [Arthromyces matolae]